MAEGGQENWEDFEVDQIVFPTHDVNPDHTPAEAEAHQRYIR